MSGTFETRIQDYPMSRLMRTEKNCDAALAEAETVTMDVEAMKFLHEAAPAGPRRNHEALGPAK